MRQEFRAAEVQTFWRYIAGSLDRLVDLVSQCPQDVVTWVPLAPGANSILVLASHTLSNTEENLLGVVAGHAVARDRHTEFDAESQSRESIVARWHGLRPRIESALAGLPTPSLDLAVAHPRRGSISGREVLIVVARHAAEHLGQAQLTRDLAVQALPRS